jgi:hypothetical protein
VPTERCSIEEQSIEYCRWHNTPTQNILSTDPQLSIYQKALEKFHEEDNVTPKHVEGTIGNKLKKQLSNLLGFHAYINEMHGSRSKIPSKKFLSGSVTQRDLIPALQD